MFAFLRGAVHHKTATAIALDVGGVGFLVHAPEPVLRRVVAGQEVTLLTHCHIREDDFLIFGFLREEEKSLFEMLLGISGVGPKVALSVVSALPPAAFAEAVLANDITAISKAQGVGKKLAQRILLETKTKMGQSPEWEAFFGEAKADAVPDGDDAYEALISLGCTPPEAKKAVAAARAALGADAADEEVVRTALRTLARK
ncbi:MAG TPA: Holliday junction branch migration protein RuvA [Candidatus Hydrogenedentes bacterium]|nr:Holliday junction branch migration protein RuvA [Candidatus Hydrogenedentota bacterium]